MQKYLLFCLVLLIIFFSTSPISFAIPTAELTFTPQYTYTHLDSTFTIDLIANPGNHQLSFMTLDITYDSTKLATVSANTECGTSFCFYDVPSAQPRAVGVYQPGKILIDSLQPRDSASPSAVAVLTHARKIATLTFKAIGKTDTPTKITFGSQTVLLSLSAQDSPSENVLLSVAPALISISAVGDIDGNGTINILDYNVLINCYGNKKTTQSCGANKDKSDFNNDGVIDGVDYNLFLRAILLNRS
jgi:hypothetical protein